MLSGEGNENREKTLIGLISKKINFARAAHSFFVHFCTVVLHDYNVNRVETYCMATLFIKEMSYLLLFTFLHCRLFFPRWPLAFLIFSPPLQIHVVQSNKKWLPIYRARCLSLNFRFPFSSLLTLQLSLLHKTRFPAK